MTRWYRCNCLTFTKSTNSSVIRYDDVNKTYIYYIWRLCLSHACHPVVTRSFHVSSINDIWSIKLDFERAINIHNLVISFYSRHLFLEGKLCVVFLFTNYFLRNCHTCICKLQLVDTIYKYMYITLQHGFFCIIKT